MVPLTCVILVVLFAIQRLGTGGIGKVFGPLMAVWFATSPRWACITLPSGPKSCPPCGRIMRSITSLTHGPRGGLILGSVVLAVTGGEALCGHGPFRTAADPLVVDLVRPAVARALLPRARRPRAPRPACGRQPLLRDGPRRRRHAALLAVRSSRRHRGRFAGALIPALFPDPPGHAAGRSSA